MRKSQLVELLLSIPTNQWARLSLFLASEFHNDGPLRRDVQALWEIVREHPNILEEEDGLTSESVYQKVYPDKGFVTGKLDKVGSELKRLVREFLLHQQINAPENWFWQQLQWARALRNRNLRNQYDLQMAKLDRMLVEEEQISIEDLLSRFLFECERYFWGGAQNPGKAEDNLEALVQSFWDYFDGYRLEIANAVMVRKYIKNINFDNPKLAALIAMEVPNEAQQDGHVFLFISRKILELFQKSQPAKEDFFEMMQLLNVSEANLSKNALRDFYTYLRNFCTLLLNAGHQDLVPVLFQIQKDNLKRGYLYEDGKLTSNTILSIVRAANRLNDAHWALNFVIEHRGKIVGDNKEEDLYHINLAYCNFCLGHYDETLAALPSTCDNIIYYLFARRLEIMSYYEQRSELTDYKINAFRMYLHRASEKFLSKDLFESNINFLNLIHQIMSSTPKDTRRAERLKQRVLEKPQIAESKWLLEKCEALKNFSV